MNIRDLQRATPLGLRALAPVVLATAAMAAVLPAAAADSPAGSAPPTRGALRPIHRFTDLLASAATQSSERSAGTARDTDDSAARDPPPQLNETAPPPVEQVEERAMQPARPPTTIKARSPDTPPRSAFAQLDGDGDGRISAEEARAALDFKADFDKLDADDDGYLSESEYRAGDSAQRNDRAEELDERDDGP